MSLTYPAIVTETSSRIIGLSVEQPACNACSSGCKNLVRLQLPSEVLDPSCQPTIGTEIEVRMSLREQLSLLTHSLMLPMFGFVLGSCLAAWIDPSDLVVVLGATFGLLTGMFFCRRASFKALDFNPV